MRNGYTSPSHELYNKMMICGLAKDVQARKFYKQLKNNVQFSELGWEKDYYTELEDSIVPIIDNPEQFYMYITAKISAQRKFWHNKSSMKKLEPDYSKG